MDRDKFAWNTTFPSLTVCPHKRYTTNYMLALAFNERMNNNYFYIDQNKFFISLSDFKPIHPTIYKLCIASVERKDCGNYRIGIGNFILVTVLKLC